MPEKQVQEKFERMVTPIERFFARSPFAIVTVMVRIKGRVTERMLNKAIGKVQQKHPVLRSRIRMDEEDNPWFTTEGVGDIPVEIVSRASERDWMTASQKFSQIPFEFEEQPAIRFILVQSRDVSELVILCHHLICDGISLAHLARDLMQHLGDPGLEVGMPLTPTPISLENLPQDVKQSGLVNYFIKRINRKWDAVRKKFNQEDYRAITDAYWSNYRNEMFTVELSEEQTTDLVETCRKEGYTVNSALTVAFLGAQRNVNGEQPSQEHVVVAADLRDRITEPAGEGMGLFAGGVQVKYKYDQKQSLPENARNFHKKVAKQFTNRNLFNEALTWSYLAPQISEAMHFKKIGGLVPEDHPSQWKLSAFSRQEDVISSILKREKLDTFESLLLGTAITNLTRLDFPREYGKLELERMVFKPGGGFPLSNIHLLLGAVTCSGKLSIVGEYSAERYDSSTMERIKEQALSLLFDR